MYISPYIHVCDKFYTLCEFAFVTTTPEYSISYCTSLEPTLQAGGNYTQSTFNNHTLFLFLNVPSFQALEEAKKRHQLDDQDKKKLV